MDKTNGIKWRKRVFRGAWILLFLFTGRPAYCQTANWQNLDPGHDGVLGISTDRAYRELLAGKTWRPVIVAVLDGGIDTAHEDLRSVLWVNEKEIPGNKRDDDHNGYVDDRFGWNFIGGPGGDVNYDNFELTRIVRAESPFYDSLAEGIIPEKYRSGYHVFRSLRETYDARVEQAEGTLDRYTGFMRVFAGMKERLGKDSLVAAAYDRYTALDEEEKDALRIIHGRTSQGVSIREFESRWLQEGYQHWKETVDYFLNMEFDPRPIVGDHYADVKERFYGNSDVCGPNAIHGTHVAGIIAADRGNGIGIAGVADHVRIMCLRVVPNGDERDKDVANGIRYAVDNGAKVINMSFAKPYSPEKGAVDEAVRYAMAHDVLIVHAAGNDGNDVDQARLFPNRYFSDSTEAGAWIEVGASGFRDDSTLIATFSNYGKRSVDLFAPGVHIYSSVPGSKYEYYNGTSMAAPVVSGLAALIREYYPRLTAIEVKEIILRSVKRVGHKVLVRVRQPDDPQGKDVYVDLSEICVSGGIANTYSALLLAAQFNQSHQLLQNEQKN